MALKSQQELAQEFIEELQSNSPLLTDTSEGSDIDIIAQTVSSAVNELSLITQQEFRKTFFDTAHGPEVTGASDDLQTLAVDHFGEAFSRPQATKAKGIVTFSRASSSAGNVLIPAGSIVKTKMTSAGNSQSFETEVDVTLTGLSINASIVALTSGPASNVTANTITVIESSLSDSSVEVTNLQSIAGGEDAQNDAEYRTTIKQLLESLKGATLGAIESKAKTVAGVVYARAIEFMLVVKQWDILGAIAVGDYFKLPRVKLYVSDANGSASSTLISLVQTAIDGVRAAGVNVEVVGATPINLDWTGQLNLNPLGPNYSILQADLKLIKDDMNTYISNLPIGSFFIRAVANAYILSKYGPTGTNDITSFYTLSPTADVSATEIQKFIPGNITV